MKVGEYFRTPWGDIGKITNIPKHDKYQDDGFYLNSKFVMCGREAMKELKSTPNIIDLIEVGDIVKIEYQGWHQVSTKFETLKFFDDEGTEYLYDEIRAIITREQLESMEYKLGD